MTRLPCSDTKIPVVRTQQEIKDMLYSVGFDRIAEMTERSGKSVLVAEYGDVGKTAQFKFEVNTDIIVKHDFHIDKASRIAWRMVYWQVKSVCDAVKYGVLTLSEAFGGNMLLTDQSGNNVKMSDFITNKIASGNFSTQSLSSQFLLTDNSKE